MAIAGGWLVDKSASVRATEPEGRSQIEDLAGLLYLCPVGELEQLYSARSARDYDAVKEALRHGFEMVQPPADIFDRALALQRDLAHHQGMWHRTPLADLFIAETALHHGLGVLHLDRGYERIAEVRPLRVRRLR